MIIDEECGLGSIEERCLWDTMWDLSLKNKQYERLRKEICFLQRFKERLALEMAISDEERITGKLQEIMSDHDYALALLKGECDGKLSKYEEAINRVDIENDDIIQGVLNDS
jgi:hypothetical protein